MLIKQKTLETYIKIKEKKTFIKSFKFLVCAPIFWFKNQITTFGYELFIKISTYKLLRKDIYFFLLVNLLIALV